MQLLVLSLLMIAALGCTRVELAFEVNEDGTGAFIYTFAQLGGTPEPSDYYSSSDPLHDVPLHALIEPFAEDGAEGRYEGFKAHVLVPDMRRLALWENELLSHVQDVAFTEDNGDWHFSMRVPPFLDEPPTALDMAEMSDEERRLLADSYLRVRVSLPGHVVQHNADRIEDGALVWDIDQLAGEERELSAQTSPNRQWWTWVFAIVVGVFVVVALLAGYAVRRIRRH